MNKIQHIELLKLRGVNKLSKGESIAAAIEKTGGQPTVSEMMKVNEAAMNYFIHENKSLREELDIADDKVKDHEKWIHALEEAGVDNWSGYEIAKEILNND